MRDKLFARDKARPLVLAHRGVAVRHPENTMKAFQAALEVGADGIEFDVFQIADGTVVVFHDENTQRLTGENCNIVEMTWDEVSKLRVNGTERIPLLEEVLAEYSGRLLLNIEMKAFSPKWGRRETGAATARIAGKYREGVFSTSFDPFMLYTLEQEDSDIVSGFTYDDGMTIDFSQWSQLQRLPSGLQFINALNGLGRNFITFLAEGNLIGDLLNSTVIGIEHTLIDDDTIAKFHKRSMAVGTYTFFSTDPTYPNLLNDEQQKARIRELAAQRLDWIETDDPEKVLEALA
ncbi:MAG TPA: glycerophosphodiester phosphodiesterase [Blastocatellia bacterium]|nr:glycerophosphodiester phosphodiesterase [Blastocatellia bacterium]HMV84767.1 glycerophosphodiester phosphodiesterase [Blastocatellia bacterium]HMX27233.1 glycerophosphodiester phosphodiesterase [Blastocatellia bacterium]HMY70221.1 glycerophosphodiester phosphodiesterase [Blastocatellia bacterium]HMZ19303.1 glycerophosphodiester phosphodiesterase [Blastocatellia bacterium]